MLMDWALTELAQADLGDLRRTQRAAQVLAALAARPGASLPAASADAAATKAAYRLLANAAVTPDALLASHVEATRQRLQGQPVILALQDTTDLNYTAHPALDGAGRLHSARQTGLLVHSVLAVTPEGVPLGLLDQHVWTRDPATVGTRHTRRHRPTAQKESQRWLAAQAATFHAVPPDTTVITIADREADLFDLFAQPRGAHQHLLIRATYNRRITQEARYLWPAVQATPVADVASIPVGRRGDREPDEALLTLRWTPVTLQPPRHHRQRAQAAPVPVTAILIEEPTPPTDQPPIQWLLLTTLAVPDAATAWACVRAYALRWRIERYHDVLKSGCRLEDRQLRTVARLERLLALCAIVAWRLLWLTYAARADPEQPCTVALPAPAWQVLWRATQRGAPLPPHPPSLGQTVRQIAQLGGFLGRAGDGEPGVTVLWRGWRRLEDLVIGWQMAHDLSPAP